MLMIIYPQGHTHHGTQPTTGHTPSPRALPPSRGATSMVRGLVLTVNYSRHYDLQDALRHIIRHQYTPDKTISLRYGHLITT